MIDKIINKYLIEDNTFTLYRTGKSTKTKVGDKITSKDVNGKGPFLWTVKDVNYNPWNNEIVIKLINPKKIK